jgi:hypothetical protein
MNLDLHPIQLKDLKFVQLHAKAFSDPSGILETEIDFDFMLARRNLNKPLVCSWSRSLQV